MMEGNNPEAFKLSLKKMLADKPDFMMTLGDIFGDDHNPFTITAGQLDSLHRAYRPFLGQLCHSIPFFIDGMPTSSPYPQSLLFGLLAFVLAKGFGSTELPNTSGTVPTQQSTSTISDLVFKPYLLPFWALSFVLLAAVIGAIVLARKD